MQDVALDACCLINLYAAGRIFSAEARRPVPRRKIASSKSAKLAFDFTMHVPVKVKEEVRYVLQPDEEDESKLVKADIDLAPLIQAAVLHECDLEGADET